MRRDPSAGCSIALYNRDVCTSASTTLFAHTAIHFRRGIQIASNQPFRSQPALISQSEAGQQPATECWPRFAAKPSPNSNSLSLLIALLHWYALEKRYVSNISAPYLAHRPARATRDGTGSHSKLWVGVALSELRPSRAKHLVCRTFRSAPARQRTHGVCYS